MSVTLNVTMDSSELSLSGEYDSGAFTPARFGWVSPTTHLLTVTPSGGSIDPDAIPAVSISDSNVLLEVLEFEVAANGSLYIWISAFSLAAVSGAGADVTVETVCDDGNGPQVYSGAVYLQAITGLLTL